MTTPAKQSAFDALCQQHHELLTAYGPYGWGRIAIEVAQDEQRKLIATNTALCAALERLLFGSEEQWPNHDARTIEAQKLARTVLAMARGEKGGE